MDEVIGGTCSRRRAAVPLISGFAFLGLLLCAVGVYGLVSYSVAQRTYEIGIKIALERPRQNILFTFLRQARRLALLGLGIEVTGALILTRFLASLLFGIETVNTATFLAVAALLIAVIFVATVIPARRAARWTRLWR